MLLGKAIDPQSIGVPVAHGLLRLDEGEDVEREVSGCFGFEWISLCANERVLGALSGISDPEEKRWVIGRVCLLIRRPPASSRGHHTTFYHNS